MPYTNNEKQRRFKEKMYNAGLKQAVLWVKREERKPAKMTQAGFNKKMKRLTAGWDEESIQQLYSLLIKIIRGKKEAGRIKEKT